jgi:integrase
VTPLPRHRQDSNHNAALPYDEVSRFIAELHASNAEPISKLAFEFLILTAARTSDVRKARWSEITFATQTWTIPGDRQTGRRMKSGREHVVPLSLRCMEILRHAKRLAQDSELVFPDTQSRQPMSENRGGQGVVHVA